MMRRFLKSQKGRFSLRQSRSGSRSASKDFCEFSPFFLFLFKLYVWKEWRMTFTRFKSTHHVHINKIHGFCYFWRGGRHEEMIYAGVFRFKCATYPAWMVFDCRSTVHCVWTDSRGCEFQSCRKTVIWPCNCVVKFCFFFLWWTIIFLFFPVHLFLEHILPPTAANYMPPIFIAPDKCLYFA